MKKKSKGLTLIELIIALALSVVILGIVYTFFLTNNRHLTLVDLQTTLQTEGRAIEDKILKVGTEAKEVVSIKNTNGINGTELINSTRTIDGLGLDINDGTLAVKSLTFNSNEGIATTISITDTNTISLGTNVLSKNVQSIKIKPLNINQMSDIDKSKKLVKDLSGYEITILLKKSNGKVETTYPISVNVKLRNKEDLDAEVRKEAKNVEVNIVNKGSIPNSLSSIDTSAGEVRDGNVIGSGLNTLLRAGQSVNIESMVFNNSKKITFLLQGKILTMQIFENGESKDIILSKGIKEFKIKAIKGSDIINDNMTLNDLPGFEIVGKVELGEGETLVSYPIYAIVRYNP